MKASVLAVGTELVGGQILNRNAQTISSHLFHRGVVTKSHLSVADDRNHILEALNYLETQSDLIFVTGGLGPTSDDFTRDIVSLWAKKNLVFDETSWKHITERLESRGLTVREHQKQQCYFPEGSQILSNSEGTANGFFFSCQKPSGEKKVFVLPGPPAEIAAIWKDHVEPWLKSQTILNPLVVKAWDVIGIPESDLAFRVEKIFETISARENLQICYRVHLPYVELKLIYPKSEESIWQPYLKVVDEALDGITVSRNFTDIADQFMQLINQATDFALYDYLSSGYLIQRLGPFLKNKTDFVFVQADEPPTADFFQEEDNFLALIPFEEDKGAVLMSLNGIKAQVVLEYPFKSNLMQQRKKQYMAEMALIDFVRSLGRLS